MTEQHLIEEISRRYKAMPRAARIAEIRKMASGSAWDASFVRRTFPDLYREAFSRRRHRAAGVRSGSAPQKKRAAKRR
jgi:hypothetical protein